MSFSLFSVAILLLFAVILGIEIYKGVKKGFMGALISLGVVVVSLILSTSLIFPLLTNIVSRVFVKYILPQTPLYTSYEKVLEYYSSMDELLSAMLALVLTAVFFVGFFFLCRIIIQWVFSIAHKISLKRRRDDVGYVAEKHAFIHNHDKLMGGIVGAVSATIITMTVLSPIMGTLEIVDKGIEVVDEIGEGTWEKLRIRKNDIEVLRSYYHDVPGSIFYHMGGKYIFHAATCTIVYNEPVYLFNELDGIAHAVVQIADGYSVLVSPGTATPADAQKVSDIGKSIAELKITRGVLADFLSNGADAWLDNRKVFKIAKPQVPSLLQVPFDEVLLVCKESDKNSIKYNVETLFNIYALIIETDLMHANISDYDSAIRFINDTRLIERVNEELAKNKYMKHIRVTSITMSAVAQQLNGSNLTDEQYDKLSNGLADMINQINGMHYNTVEEKADVLKDSAKNYISDAMGEDVEIPDSVIEAVSIELLQELENKENVTADDVKAIFDRYAN